MVQITTLALALAATASTAVAYTNPCIYETVQCGFTLNGGDAFGNFFGYTEAELTASLSNAGFDLNLEDVIYSTLYRCVDRKGTVIAETYCGAHKCVNPDGSTAHPTDGYCRA